MAAARRLASPPAKSAAPQKMAARRPERIERNPRLTMPNYR
jgi:hypothetical protein